MLANALPVGFSAEELGSGILQPGLESFSQTGVFPVLRELVFLKDIFRLNISQCISFSRNADGQGVCGGAEAYEGFFRIFSTGHYKRPYPTEKGNICS